MFSAVVLAAAQAHGVAEYPKEAGGLIVDGAYIPCENIASKPEQNFEIEPALGIKYRGRIEGLIHSHPDWWPVPGEADMRQQAAMDVPWGIYNTDGKTTPGRVGFSRVVWFGRQIPKAPLIGRGFIHGIQDCLSEIEDWHAIQGIKLPMSPRDWEWWLPGVDENGNPTPAKDFYRDLFEPYGFERIDGPVAGATFFGPLGKYADGREIMVPNHGGVWLGDGRVLHHRGAGDPIDMSRLSARIPLSMRTGYFNAPPIWVRHRDLPLKGLREI
jgi:proteasome lid subunit RPN8/RPN11